jgi:uncharacterized protein (TIGR03905 family)
VGYDIPRMKRNGKRAPFTYLTEGTCCTAISFRVAGGRLKGVTFTGGCSGNTQGLSRMLEGCRPGEAHERLKGIKCGSKRTSCPDQFARAIEAWKEGKGGKKGVRP